MSQVLPANKRKILTSAIQLDNSSELSASDNKNRMKQFKTLSLKGNSVMEHLFSHHPTLQKKQQSSVLFKSEKWTFEPRSEEKQRNLLTSSCNFSAENPFYRAKQNLLKKSKLSETSSVSANSLQDITHDLQEDNKRTTFRLIRQSTTTDQVQSQVVKLR